MNAAMTQTLVTTRSVSNALVALTLAPTRLWDELGASLHFHGLSALQAAEDLLPRPIRGAVAGRARLMARDTDAVTIIEYALIGGIVSVALTFILPELKNTVGQMYLEVSTGVVNAAAPTQPQPPTP